MDSISKLQALQQNVESVLFGKSETVHRVLVALLARGHVLIEDVPGVGKTILTRAVAKSLDCTFSRIQLTPDLLPSDILGVSVYEPATGEFMFKHGPIFAHVVLVDEINRTTPRTQSALLEAMNEAQVTADGQSYPLGPPFMVLATQNPYEFEGTYFLPESQLDRFMLRVRVGYPDAESERRILRRQPARTQLQSLEPVMDIDELLDLQRQVLDVKIEEEILDYIVAIAETTRRSEELTTGLSPRGSLALTQAAKAAALLGKRNYVVPDDVRKLASSVCAHRIQTRAFTHETAAGETVFQQLLETVPVPR
jgi:MoxR-like ATPase